MKQTVLALLFLWAITVFTLSGCTRSDMRVPLGAVTSIHSGSLERFKDNAWTAVTPGNKLFAGDRLRTNDTGYAVITLDRIGRFLLAGSSEYEVGADAADFRSFLRKGSIWYYSLLSKGGKMNISTFTAVAGARGTAFSVITNDEGTDVCTCDGTVDFAARNGAAFPVRAGRFSMIKKGERTGEGGDGKRLLAQLRKGDLRGYGICLRCHQDGKKPNDITLQSQAGT